MNVKMDEYYDFFGKDYLGPGILIIVVGVLIFLIAFFGCCGAYKENYCLTMTVSEYEFMYSILAGAPRVPVIEKWFNLKNRNYT